ncbi:MAG: DHHA1 domain-containing protein [Nitrososphaerales archaeon]
MSTAHTAEHLFAGSLRKIRPDVTILKVDQAEGRNSIYVGAKSLDWDTVLKAEEMANRVISEGRDIKEHFFDSLEDARRRFPEARAMEERITGGVRIVEVEGYDYAACIREHASNTRECDFFLVTRVVKAGGEGFQIDFLVGEDAKVRALELSKISLSTADMLGAPIGVVEKTVENMLSELQDLRRRLSALSEREAEDIPFSKRGRVKIYSKVFEGLDAKKLMKKAGELIGRSAVVVLFANITEDATVIFARSSDLSFDSGVVLKRVLSRYGGRGGGRPEFASGSVDRSKVEEVFRSVLDAVFN